MKMTRHKECIGRNRLDQSQVNDWKEVQQPYFIFGVEDGQEMLDKQPEKAEVFIKKQERFCLTGDEGIALCIHSDVLSWNHLGIYCITSCYGNTGVLCIELCSGKPELVWKFKTAKEQYYGSASCKHRW